MSKPTQKPLDVLPDAQSSRRSLLKGLLVGLGQACSSNRAAVSRVWLSARGRSQRKKT